MNKFDEEVFKSLSGKIRLTEKNESYFDLIENCYPLGLNRIKWSHVHGHLEVVLSEKTERAENISMFLTNIARDYDIAIDDEVVIWGDGAIDCAYSMIYADFLKNYLDFFDLPQHTYVWFKRIHKILNYTFEDELFFG